MAKSTRRKRKPQKPNPDYPLFAHATGRWAKKILGKFHYFGPWDDPQAALERFTFQWPYLSVGRTPPETDSGDWLTLRELVNQFLSAKDEKLKSGELSPRTFRDYHQTCARLIDQFGKDRRVDDLRPEDFASLRKAIAAQWGVVRLRNEITRVRTVFKFAIDGRLIDRPVFYGTAFDKPTAKSLRIARAKRGPKMFSADELRTIIDAVSPVMRAAVLLGVNAGLGNSDIARLPIKSIDFKTGWLDYPREKTGVPRRVPLWDETLAAARIAIDNRPKPVDKSDERLAFLTCRGVPWVRIREHKTDPSKRTPVDVLGAEFRKLTKRLGIAGSFYWLRHVTETIGGASKDQTAVNAILGHVDESMSATYRERIDDERLEAVTDHVRAWLWPEITATGTET